MFFSTAPTTPSLKALTNELKSVLDWHSLGVNLDLKRYQLSEIERNHRGDDKRCKTEILACWLENTTNPTWETIAEALCLMEAHAIADKIRRKHITSTTTTEGKTLIFFSERCMWRSCFDNIAFCHHHQYSSQQIMVSYIMEHQIMNGIDDLLSSLVKILLVLG